MRTLDRFAIFIALALALFAQPDAKIAIGGDVAQPLALTKDDPPDLIACWSGTGW